MFRLATFAVVVLLFFYGVLPAAAQGPTLAIASPANGSVISGTTVVVDFKAGGFNIVPSTIPLSEAGKRPDVNRPGEGQVHLMLDLQPLVIDYQPGPYTFHNVPPGQHELMVELVNNDHGPLAPAVVQQVSFQTVVPTAPAMPSGQEPSLAITYPASGSAIDGASVTVDFQVSGMKVVPSTVPLAEAGKHPEANQPGEGHLHLMLDLQPLVVWYQTGPYTFNNVPPGTHQLMVEMVNNDHSSLSPKIVRMVEFRTNGPNLLPVTGGQTANLLPALVAAAVLSLVLGLALELRQAAGSEPSEDRR